jgi:hypothetical protein
MNATIDSPDRQLAMKMCRSGNRYGVDAGIKQRFKIGVSHATKRVAYQLSLLWVRVGNPN